MMRSGDDGGRGRGGHHLEWKRRGHFAKRRGHHPTYLDGAGGLGSDGSGGHFGRRGHLLA